MKRCFVVILMVALSAMAQLTASPPQRQTRPTPPAAEAQAEAQALKQDIARMRSLLRQMEMNLALVQTTQTPLKHQFDLEVEMWRVVLNGMERRVDRMQGQPAGGVVAPGTVPLQRDPGQEKP